MTSMRECGIIPVFCGRGGIGIRARLRGVSSNGYGFKSRRPHFSRLWISTGFFISPMVRRIRASLTV